MSRKTLNHKGYQGTIEVDTEDYSLWGRILFVPEEIIFKGISFAELNENFQEAVESYIATTESSPSKTD